MSDQTEEQKKRKLLQVARSFEFYLKYGWPIHRLFVKGRISRRCTRCAASERMILLNQNGLCAVCQSVPETTVDSTHASHSNQNVELAFRQTLEEAQGRGRGAYDALVLFSGGKDSTYMIMRLKDEFPNLRLLALTLDNTFMSPIAKENIQFLIEKLNVDHLIIRPRREFYIKLFRYALLNLNENGCYGTLDFSDGEFLLDTARHLAAQKKIPLILCGYSKYQVQNGLGIKSFEMPREREEQDRTHTASLELSKIFTEKERLAWWHASQYDPKDIARLIFPLYCWDLEEEQILKEVKEKGFLPQGKMSPIVTNHLLIPLLGVIDVHRFGYSSFESEFTRMIRDGKADLKHWKGVFELLEYTAKTGLFLKDSVNEALNWLELTTDEVGIKFTK